MGEQFAAGLGDVMRFSRGIATLGLVGEKDLEKLLRGLVKIQAAFDIIGGGLQMWVKASKLMRDFTAATEAAAAAQTALALAQGGATTTGGVAAAGAAGGAVAQGIAGGAAVGAVGKAASGLKSTAIGGAVAGLTVKGIGAAGAVLGPLKTAAVAVTAALLSLPSAIAIAATSFVALGAMITNVWGSKDKVAAMMEGLFKPGSVLGWLAGKTMARGPRAEFDETEKRSTRMAAASIFRREQQERETAEATVRMQERLASAKTPQQQLGIARAGVEENAEGAIQAQTAALEKIISLRKQEKSAVDATNKAAIEGLRQQAKQHLALADQVKKARMSAEERFGAMSAVEQAEILKLSQQAIRTLKAPEIQKVLGAMPEGSQQAERLHGELRRRGRLAGTGRLFGRAEEGREAGLRSQAERWKAEANQTEILLKDDRNFVVKIERDDTGLIRRLVPEVQRALNEKDDALREELREALANIRDEEAGRLLVEKDKLKTATTRAMSPGHGSLVTY